MKRHFKMSKQVIILIITGVLSLLPLFGQTLPDCGPSCNPQVPWVYHSISFISGDFTIYLTYEAREGNCNGEWIREFRIVSFNVLRNNIQEPFPTSYDLFRLIYQHFFQRVLWHFPDSPVFNGPEMNAPPSDWFWVTERHPKCWSTSLTLDGYEQVWRPCYQDLCCCFKYLCLLFKPTENGPTYLTHEAAANCSDEGDCVFDQILQTDCTDQCNSYYSQKEHAIEQVFNY